MTESKHEEFERLSDEAMTASKEQFGYIAKYRDREKPPDYSDQLQIYADRAWDLAQRMHELATE